MEHNGWLAQTHLVGRAAHALIDVLESPRTCTCPTLDGSLPPDPTPVSTGIAVLDAFLGGGLRRGALTIVESSDDFLLDAIGFSVARSLPVAGLLAHPNLYEATCWIVAGEADVSVAGLLADSGITADEVIDMRFATRRLDEIRLTLADASDPDTLIDHVLPKIHDLEVVVIADAHRYPQPRHLLSRLSAVALRDGLAVLVTIQASDTLTAGLGAESVVAAVGSDAGDAILVRPDDDEMLALCELDTDLLTGQLRARAATTS